MESPKRIKQSLVYLFLCFSSLTITVIVTVIFLPFSVRFKSITNHEVTAVLLLYLLINLFVYVFYEKMKSKKKAILLTAAFVLTIFLLQQIYGYVRTGRSCIFTYRGSITPKDFGCIVDDIREQLIIMLHGNKGPLDAKSFCELIDKLELAENQPLKDRGIELIHNKETNTIYLYGTKAISEFLKKTYPTYSDEWHVLLVVNKSLYEKPKGKYHAFMLSRKGNDWLAVTTQIGVQIDSWVPPIPGCLYNVEEKKLYVPPELLPAYKIIYPNLDIPVTSFMELSSVM